MVCDIQTLIKFNNIAADNPIVCGELPNGKAYEIHELTISQADSITAVTSLTPNVISKSLAQVTSHFEIGGHGLAIFSNNLFAGQILIKDEVVNADLINCTAPEAIEKLSDVFNQDQIKVSTVSSFAQTPIEAHRLRGCSYPLINAWYDNALDSKCDLLQACVQVGNHEGLNMFTRNDFFTDGKTYKSPNGEHDVFFMYRPVISEVSPKILIPIADHESKMPLVAPAFAS